eukprot:1041603-Prymnesium_polylepis.3
MPSPCSQDFIIDGSGVYITRNSQSYTSGRYELSDNTCSGNGINGLVVHKTNRVLVKNNNLFDNGKVSRDPPASRQKYAGLTIHTSMNVSTLGNFVDAPFDDDLAYQMLSTSSFDDHYASGTNYICRGKINTWNDDVPTRVVRLARCTPPPPSPPPAGPSSPPPPAQC